VTSAHPDKPYPILIGSRDIYEGRVIKLRVDEIEVKNGLNVRREVIEHPGAVVILPIDNEGNVLWERQYRYAAGRYLMELPAGTLEKGEDPADCARRELIEETGFAGAEWQLLGRFFSAPGFCTEYMYCFLATNLTPDYAEGDEDEDIEIVPLSLEDSLAMIDRGEVEDAKSLAAMHLYLRKRAK
jgi:ADP-ribose pyrophosphatase